MRCLTFRLRWPSRCSCGRRARSRNEYGSNPVAYPTLESAPSIFSFEACGRADKGRRVESLKGVDIDDCIQMVVNRAGNKRYGATGRAHVEFGGPRSKLISRDNGLIANNCDELGITMRRPRSAVLGAESTVAYSDRDVGSIIRPIQCESDVSAVTRAFDLHGYQLRYDRRLGTLPIADKT